MAKFSYPPRRSMHWSWRLYILGLWLTGATLVAWLAHDLEEKKILDQLELSAATNTRDLSVNILEFRELSTTLALLPSPKDLLLNPSPVSTQQMNRFLMATNERLGSELMFIMDHNGTVVGASNFSSEESLLGRNFAFRPYFQQSILGEPATYYARGAVTNRRGYFFSTPIIVGDQTLGVTVIKLSLESLFEELQEKPFDYLIVGNNGVIFASSNPHWSQHTLYPMPPGWREFARSSRRYGNAPLTPIGDNSASTVFDKSIISLATGLRRQNYYSRHDLVTDAGWHYLAVTPATALWLPVASYVGVYTLAFVVVFIAWLYRRKRREVHSHIEDMNAQLEGRVHTLTHDLVVTNREQAKLLEHYQRAQKELKDTHDQLVHAAKMAVLGELSASINHELNQPLLALITYAQNGLRLLQQERFDTVEDNLNEMLDIAHTMQKIVARLKVFARKSAPETRPTYSTEILDACRTIVGPLLKNQNTQLIINDQSTDQAIVCDPVPIAQVLVNLITNAVDAQEPGVDHAITVNVTPKGNEMIFEVNDNGPGIAIDQADKIFEPFYSTKSTGLGIGLALSKKMVEMQLGKLRLLSDRRPGATFQLTLPLYMESQA